jgi:uncharacterized protein (DUF305 family)
MKDRHSQPIIFDITLLVLLVVTPLLLGSCGIMDRNIGPPPTPTPEQSGVVAQVIADASRDFEQLVAQNPDLPYDALLIDALVAHLLGSIDLANQGVSRIKNSTLRETAQTIVDSRQQFVVRLQQERSTAFPDLPITPASTFSIGATELTIQIGMDFDQPFLAAMAANTQGGLAIITTGTQQAERPELRALLGELEAAYREQLVLLGE